MRQVNSLEDIAEVKTQMLKNPPEDVNYSALIDQCEQWALSITTHAKLKHLYRASLWAKNESVLLAPGAALFIPDRLVLIDDAYSLIEYKTGEAKKAHIDQVDHYAQLIDEMHAKKPKVKVKERIIIYLRASEPEITITYT
jgi:hypothetical protein